MKTLHFYLLRQVLATLAMTVFVFTFVLLLGNVIRDVMEVIVGGQASLGLIFHMIALIIPWVLAFSLPMGMLTAALLVCGRLSADQELLAVRASGVSLVSLVTPILLLSVAMSALCLWINCDVAPRSRVAFKALFYKSLTKDPVRSIRAGQYITIDNYTLYAGKVDGTNLGDVMIYINDDHGNLAKVYSALRATITHKPNDTNVFLHLEDAYSSFHNSDGWFPGPQSGSYSSPFPLPSTKSGSSDIDFSDMTFGQLSEKLKQLDAIIKTTQSEKSSAPELQSHREAMKKANREQRASIVVNLHREVAFSFACIGFTLIGIPLGIRAHRRETSIGIAIALLLVLVYYSFLILGQAWQSNPDRHPHLLMWLPNFLFQIIGGIMLWKANQRG